MKIELTKKQIELLLDGLDALNEVCTSESRATDDVEIINSNVDRVVQGEELYYYILQAMRQERGSKRI